MQNPDSAKAFQFTVSTTEMLPAGSGALACREKSQRILKATFCSGINYGIINRGQK